MSAETTVDTDPDGGSWYALDRDVDPKGVSGTGRIAYVLLLDSGVLVLWDTRNRELDKPTQGIEWLPSAEMCRALHTYAGQTRMTCLDVPGQEDWPAILRGEELLRKARTHLEATVDELDGAMS